MKIPIMPWVNFSMACLCAIGSVIAHSALLAFVAAVNVFVGGINYEIGKRKDGP